MNKDEFDAIRSIFPEIPENCTEVSIDGNGVDRATTITVTFYPTKMNKPKISLIEEISE